MRCGSSRDRASVTVVWLVARPRFGNRGLAQVHDQPLAGGEFPPQAFLRRRQRRRPAGDPPGEQEHGGDAA
jgi:hypothetical protein